MLIRIFSVLLLLPIVGWAGFATWEGIETQRRDANPRMSAFRAHASLGPDSLSTGAAALPPIDVPPKSRWIARSADEKLSSGIWESGVGTFEFQFRFDEVVYIIDGEVVVHTDHGSQLLRAGDTGFFPRGLHMRWEIKQPIRKVWVHRYPDQPLLTRVRDRVSAAVAALRP